ncbi:hypothetical protein SCHPADRAFT_930597 [Schizopora paradoxa]|uniref:Protein phosphatase n=1 Tax=Schizopora paradoxa TaxID=27342 RepID=A0A0H2RFN8_9AGAM|nr:hypothetical protein SCHPADRAFT_930597 [Schizopora paradoxa]
MHPSKTISTTKRLCTVFIPSQASSSTSAAVAVLRRRPRAHSASSSGSPPSSSSSTATGPAERRTFYTAATGVNGNPLQYFDAATSSSGAGPSSPSPSSRPGNPHVLSTQRLPYGESHNANSNSGSGSHSQHGGSQQSHSSTANQPLLGSSSFPTTVNPHPSCSPQPDRPFSSKSSHSRFHETLAASSSSSSSTTGQSSDALVADEASSKSSFGPPKRLFQLDVGAYGIPKRGHVSRYACEASDFAGLDAAVQVGEDAYFVRDDAMGVADGVGGWASSNREKRASPSPRPRHSSGSSGLRNYIHRDTRHEPSPSALFARRLMHFCAVEAAEARSRAQLLHETTHSRSNYKTPGIPSTLPSLKHNVVRDLSSRTTQQKHRNARPFLWPWEEEGIADSKSDPMEDSSVCISEATEDAPSVDPLDVLERAYSRAIDAHVVRVNPSDPAPTATSGASHHPSSPSPDLRLDHAENSSSRKCNWKPLRSGSSTALLATLSGDRLRIAHLGDCSGLLVRGGDVVWRSEEMWWGFNFPLQLGPSSPTLPQDARTYELRVQADDILVLASDGMSDNLWEEDVVDEVRRFVGSFKPFPSTSPPAPSPVSTEGQSQTLGTLGRRALAGMLSEALCSRARRVSERTRQMQSNGCSRGISESLEDLPFSRRAKEEGRSFRGGKWDDISVLVAVITPSS